MSTATYAEGTVCKPNISSSGRRMRMRVGYASVAIGVALLGWALATHAAWYWRALLVLPAMSAAIGFLQATRHTCVARAAEGTFEHEDMSKTKAEDADVAASRKVASAIKRDTVLIGVAAGALAAATAFIG